MKNKFVYLLLLILTLPFCGYSQRVVVEMWPDSTDKVVFEITKGTVDSPEEYYYVKYYPNGNIYKEGKYIRKEASGPWRFYYQDGKLKSECTYSSGHLIGDYVSYYNTGEVEQKGLYQVGQVTNLELFNRDGSPKNQNEELSNLVVDQAQPWTEEEQVSGWIDCYMPMDGVLPKAAEFCKCIIDSVATYVENDEFELLSEYQRSLLFKYLMDEKGYCRGLIEPELELEDVKINRDFEE